MQKIIAGNWKMNGSKSEINLWCKTFFQNLLEFEKNNKENAFVLINIPDIYIDYTDNLINEYNKKTKYIKVNLGVQNIHQEDKGAFTGNNSSMFLKDFNIKYTLVGHSERRIFEKESNQTILSKAINAIKNQITPIVCIGENLEIRENKQHLDFIKQQVLETTNNVDLTKVIIAYEPVWAIGTGKVPTIEEIEEIGGYIKTILSNKNNLEKEQIIILYGGSVKSSNVKEIVNLNSISGVLVGGASLKGDEFFNIVKNCL